MMHREIIAVDADDTLFNETDAIRRFMNHTYGFRHTDKDYLVTGDFKGYWERIWRLPADEARVAFHAFLNSDYKRHMQPTPDAPRVLRQLKQTYDLAVITARGEKLADLTHNALAAHYPGLVDDVYFVPMWNDGRATKAEICRAIGARYLVDDVLSHCAGAAAVGVNAVLYGDFGWSRGKALPAGVTRCQDWRQVATYFAQQSAA